MRHALKLDCMDADSTCMETIFNAIRDTWDSLLGRSVVIVLAVGWVPFVLLSKAHASLVG